MQTVDKIATSQVSGRITVWRIPPRVPGACRTIRMEELFRQQNQIQVGWGMAAAMSLGFGERSYRISSMYLEYENVADPEDVITPPTYDANEGREYYSNLAFSGTRDFLRVPLLLQPSLGIESGYEDFFTEGVTGNRLTFHAQTQGTIGFNGKAFNDGVNSKVFGVALVATPDFNDPTQDIVFARTYFDPGDQTPKLASSQVGITWDIIFGM